MDYNFLHLLQASVMELQDLHRKGALTIANGYGEVLLAYLQGDIDGLEKIISQISDQRTLDAAKLRLQIRQVKVIKEQIEKVRAYLDNPAEDIDNILWKAELLFILAMAHEGLSEDKEASACYQESAKIFDCAGANRKSIKAFQNYVAAESRVNRNKRFLVEYTYIHREARRLGEMGTAGAALNNISREYQKLGALKSALKYSDRALACLKKDFGSLQYYLTLVHRADILLALGRSHDAELTMEEAKQSTFPEVLAAIAVLGGKIANPDHLFQTWKDRNENRKIPKLKLGALEDKLIKFLMEKPRGRYEIIEHLYGEALDIEAAENRLKNLVARIRKRHPDLIIRKDEKYCVSDAVFYSKHFKRSA